MGIDNCDENMEVTISKQSSVFNYDPCTVVLFVAAVVIASFRCGVARSYLTVGESCSLWWRSVSLTWICSP